MGIVDDDVVKVREATDVVALIGEHLQLKRVGRRFVGLCPFHGEKSPSFSVNSDLGLYYCFGCQAKGDAITFVREIEHLDFVGAVEKLAHRAGVTLRYTERNETEGRKKRTELTEAMAAAVAWYHARLLEAPDAAAARGYLRSRGFDGETVRRYQIGWAPEGWDELVRAVKLPAKVMVDAGLAYMNQRNRPTDSFRGRVLFPIFDPQGDPVAFGGRIMPGGQGPKYKNSPETRLYDKSKVLYGLNWHKAAIVATGEVIVCEGYTDVIGFARAGLDRAVATCGTSLTDEHVRLLQRFAQRVVLAFDADAAGQAAAERFYGWERSHELEVHVADLPAGADPGDLAQHDPDRLRAAIEGAKPFLRFRFERVLGSASLGSPEGRAKAAQTALTVIAEHPDELVRDQYRMELSDRCQIDIDRLRAQPVPAASAGSGGADARRAPRGGASRDGSGRDGNDPGGADHERSGAANRSGKGARTGRDGAGDRGASGQRPELQVLRFAVHDPGPLAGQLDELLFTDPVALSAYRALASAETFHQALERAEPAAAELLQRMAVEEPEGEPDDVLARLVEESVRREVASLEVAARQHNSVEYLRSANVDVAEAKLQVERLREPESRRDATGQLLGWLQNRAEERHD